MKRGRLGWKWLATLFIFDLIVLALVVPRGTQLVQFIASDLYETEKNQRDLTTAPVWALTPDEMRILKTSQERCQPGNCQPLSQRPPGRESE